MEYWMNVLLFIGILLLAGLIAAMKNIQKIKEFIRNVKDLKQEVKR